MTVTSIFGCDTPYIQPDVPHGQCVWAIREIRPLFAEKGRRGRQLGAVLRVRGGEGKVGENWSETVILE